jgi:hypothetical protein
MHLTLVTLSADDTVESGTKLGYIAASFGQNVNLVLLHNFTITRNRFFHYFCIFYTILPWASTVYTLLCQQLPPEVVPSDKASSFT